MEYLQYYNSYCQSWRAYLCFKPYYKWNTFNTKEIINLKEVSNERFKPYYKWNTFNTGMEVPFANDIKSFKPYYKWNTFNTLTY